MNENYNKFKKMFAIQNDLAQIIKTACPDIGHFSGIYFLIREDKDENKKYAYIGKGVDVLRRMVSHLQGYKQDIDFSLRKRGFYSESNLGGYKLNILRFQESQLNEKESFYIDAYLKAGYILYNVESGGTLGKTDIKERKPTRTYKEGIEQGKKSILNTIKIYFTKYLDFTIKGNKNKIKEKKYEEFKNLIK